MEAQQTAGKINATYLHTFFNGTSEAENTRLAVMVATLMSNTGAEVATAVRDWSTSFKGKPERATVQTRGSEVKALKAAMDTGYTPDTEKGWHPNIAAARATLIAKGLTNSGKPKVDRLERAKVTKATAIAVKALTIADNDVSKISDVLPEAADEVARDVARKLAAVVVARHGVIVAEHMSVILMDMVQVVAQAEADKAAGVDGKDSQEAAQDLGSQYSRTLEVPETAQLENVA